MGIDGAVRMRFTTGLMKSFRPLGRAMKNSLRGNYGRLGFGIAAAKTGGQSGENDDGLYDGARGINSLDTTVHPGVIALDIEGRFRIGLSKQWCGGHGEDLAGSYINGYGGSWGIGGPLGQGFFEIGLEIDVDGQMEVLASDGGEIFAGDEISITILSL